jgi:DNA mismatch repair protein MutS2
MAFRVAQETLEALEWPRITALLREQCHTAAGLERLETLAEASGVDASNPTGDGAGGGESLFASSPGAVREQHAQTSEARALLDAEQIPPLGGSARISGALARAQKGGVLELQQLRDVRGTLATLQALARYLRGRREEAPLLSALGDVIDDHDPLLREIDLAVDESGQVRDSASPGLASARRDTVRLAGDLQKRLGRYLQNADVTAHLSDSYYTVRNDRYVLPVKADARSRVPGIVHDASRSGTTLFVEPEAVVELNNRLKQAELAVLRETERILRHLSESVARSAPGVRAGLATLAEVDLAFARGRLSQRMAGVAPEIGEEGIYELPGLRHPLIDPAECVANDLRIGEDWSVLVLSGPNAGGKTVAMKSVALAALFVRAGLHLPCDPGARADLAGEVIADIGDGQDIGESLSTFSAHMARQAEIVRRAGKHSVIVLDEIGVGTDPGEGAALAQAILERLADAGARVITTTHYNLLKEMADIDPRFCNASVEFDPQTLAPTYRLHVGLPGASSASAVAARMGMPSAVLERADALLQREDRQLDSMLAELAASRATLESEQQQAAALRAESESVRRDYQARLERLQERRDELFRAMRSELDQAFAEAHGEVAAVIRELQRGPSSQQAARAREKLQAIEADAPLPEAPSPASTRTPGLVPIDWRRIAPGDPIRVEGGREGVLVSLPDRKGRVTVRVGGAKLVLLAERVGARAKSAGNGREGQGKGGTTEGDRRVRVERSEGEEGGDSLGGGTLECDLRGQRVDEAVDRLQGALDRAAADGRDGLRIIHGFGTGALRKAVREQLRASPFVRNIRSAEDKEGGDGVTLAEIG